MKNSLGRSVYRFISRHAQSLAEKKLQKRMAQGKEDPSRLPERLGTASEPRPNGLLMWFHAASVGESLSILELIRRLSEARSDIHFLITTGTQTSARLMQARKPARSIHQFIPVDTLNAVTAFLDHWHPDLAIWTESEFWPSLMEETDRRAIPMILINARMSKKSHDKWRWVPRFSTHLINCFSKVLAQDETTARYIKNLGLEPDKLEVTGSLKEGSSALPHDEAERQRIANQIKGRPIWLAASTHPGEEEIVAAAHKAASRMTQELLLILVPRHPERGNDIAAMLRAGGWRVAQRSNAEPPKDDTQIYLADTLGELGLWFRIAPVSFIGGSLVPVGGHNPFEPAALGSAILHGPHVFNFADIFTRLHQASATLQVTDATSLADTVFDTMSPDKAANMAHAAWQVCSEGAEVTDRVMEVLIDYLPQASVPVGNTT